eukprot:6188637-Pleurochrysis_carterae.AAC.1
MMTGHALTVKHLEAGRCRQVKEDRCYNQRENLSRIQKGFFMHSKQQNIPLGLERYDVICGL